MVVSISEIALGILGCDKVIKGFVRFHVKMKNNGCTWLYEGLFLFWIFNSFLQQNLVFIVLELQSCDRG